MNTLNLNEKKGFISIWGLVISMILTTAEMIFVIPDVNIAINYRTIVVLFLVQTIFTICVLEIRTIFYKLVAESKSNSTRYSSLRTSGQLMMVYLSLLFFILLELLGLYYDKKIITAIVIFGFVLIGIGILLYWAKKRELAKILILWGGCLNLAFYALTLIMSMLE